MLIYGWRTQKKRMEASKMGITEIMELLTELKDTLLMLKDKLADKKITLWEMLPLLKQAIDLVNELQFEEIGE